MKKVKVIFTPGIRYLSFEKILERNFLDVDQEEIDNKKKNFMHELKQSYIGEEEIAEDLIYYFKILFSTAQIKTTDKPLHVSRDFALELYTKVFSNMFDDVMWPRKKGYVKKRDPRRKTNFLMFLAGIIDDPDTSSPISKEIGLIALSDEPVLITGETGTGKELHAKAIHYLSKRSTKKFMAINCAGIPDTLLESELFGILKGVATGVMAKDGILDAVGEGTLFLDEIGDMPLTLQSKVLRVLQSREFNKVGDPKTLYKFKGRVIAATNRDLKRDIEQSPRTFRPDLYYRLNVLPIELLPLRNISERERKTAILNKLRHIIFLKREEPGDITHMKFLSGSEDPVYVADGKGLIVKADNPFISNEALQLLVNYDFPGNYRELDNILKRVYVFSGSDKIEVSVLPGEVINFNKTKPPQGGSDISSVDNIFLKDIVGHAEKIKKDIVCRKVVSLYRSGRTLKGALKAEGVNGEKDYTRIRKRIVGIIGKEQMSHIAKGL